MSFVETSTPSEFTDEEEFEDEGPLEGEFDETPVSEEDRARAMGWKPLPADPNRPQPHEFRGDPRRWSPAAEFIAHGEEELPILRDQNRRMSERIARMEPELTSLRNTAEEQKAAIIHVTNLAKRADERGYERAKAELLAERRAAVEAGDVEAHDQVQEQLDALEESRAEAVSPPPPPPPPPPAAPGVAPEITQFVQDHPWFLSNPRLKTAMIAQHNAVIDEEPDWPVQDQLDEALERMTKLFPEVAALEGQPPVPKSPPPPPAQPRRRAPASLTPSSGEGRQRSTGSPIDRIQDPAERAQARAAFNSVKRADPGFTEAEYMAIYEDPKIDAVELRRQRKTT